MSFLIRPTVVFAIIFGCFAALIPRILFPLFRSKSSSSPSTNSYENFRLSPVPLSPVDTSNKVENDLHSLDLPTDDKIEPVLIDPTESKSMYTFALPMYSVGIVLFFLYTCCKYFSRRNRQEMKLRERYSSENIRWNSDQRRFKYEAKSRIINDEEETEEDRYDGLDPDYVAYLKERRQKEKQVQHTTNAEQTKMHHTLDSMKNSLSFINTKLAANETRGNLSHNELSELQDRLAATEAQMYQILNAIDTASNKVQALSNKNSRQSLEQEEERLSAHDDVPNDDEPSFSDNQSFSRDEDDEEDEDEEEEEEEEGDGDDEEDEEEEESSSSSYDDDEMKQNENCEDQDDQSEVSSEPYGLMETNYDSDPMMVDDYEINVNQGSDAADNSRTKVYEWRKRNNSESSKDQDQTLPENGNEATS